MLSQKEKEELRQFLNEFSVRNKEIKKLKTEIKELSNKEVEIKSRMEKIKRFEKIYSIFYTDNDKGSI